jgi:general secretion pathway protein K
MIRQSGLALVLVLWVISLLTIMAGSFALGMRRETSIITGIRNNAQAQAIAESGIALAETKLLDPDQNKRWRADGSIYEIISADAKIRVRLLSESGKIDINQADRALLEKLFSLSPLDEKQQTQLVSAIIDWRDQDDLIQINGAERKEYKDAGLNHQPSNKPFQAIEELQLVLGMNEAVFKWLEEMITVYSGQQQVDLQLASREVLQLTAGLDADQLNSYLETRLESARNGQPVPPFPAVSGQNNAAAGQNSVLTIISEAQLNEESSAIISAVVSQFDEAQEKPFQVLKWRNVTDNSASLFTDAMSELVVQQYYEPELNN